MVVHVNPQTAFISHRFSADNAIQVHGGAVVLVPNVHLEIIAIDELLVTIGTADVPVLAHGEH